MGRDRDRGRAKVRDAERATLRAGVGRATSRVMIRLAAITKEATEGRMDRYENWAGDPSARAESSRNFVGGSRIHPGLRKSGNTWND